MKEILTAIASLALLSACNEDRGHVEPTADPQAGMAIVQMQCTGCHTLEGGGKTAEIPNLAAQPEDYLADAMFAYRKGLRRHAALQDLIAGFSEADIRNIAAYFAGLPAVMAAPAEKETDATYITGEEVAAACVRCHGEAGFSTTAGVPNLAGQHPMYLIVATQEYATGSRNNAEKQEMLNGLGNIDIEKMAMYFAAQAPKSRTPPPFGDVAAGEAQTAVCGSCHGDRGVGDDPMVPNLAGQEPNYLVKAIKAYRDHERGHEEMVADKSDQEIEDIAAFYSVQQAGSVSETGEQIEAIVAKCERCHGTAAGESAMIVPSLRGQKRGYLLRVMKEYRDEQRGNSMMHKMSAGYSDQVLAEIAEYYATHPM